jgi:hypothetical protein
MIITQHLSPSAGILTSIHASFCVALFAPRPAAEAESSRHQERLARSRSPVARIHLLQNCSWGRGLNHRRASKFIFPESRPETLPNR